MISQKLLKRFLPLLLALGVCGAAPAAMAETSEVNASGFLISLHQEVKATPDQVFLAVGQIGKWWNSEHTWSGNAANLSLALTAGSCFCERWDGNSVQHAQVIMVRKDAVVRMAGALGPLQDMAVNAVLTFAIEVKDGKTLLNMNYRVNGGANSGLDQLASAVDGVLTEQMHRLVSYVDTGTPK
jgi:hypothetical protein